MDNFSKNLLEKNDVLNILLLLSISKLILNVPANIVLEVSSGTIINLFFIFIIGFFILKLLLKLFNIFKAQDIFDISFYLGGNVLKSITLILFLSMIIFSISITIIDFSHILQIIYFEEFSIFYILLFFLTRTSYL